MNTYLLEIGLEEMPAQMILPAASQLENHARKTLETYGLKFSECRTYSTPRRLAVQLRGLPESQEDRLQELKGPLSSIAREENGEWSRAALGFAKKNGVSPELLEIREHLGRDYLYAVLPLQGRPVTEILKEEVAGWIEGMNFPKNMRWGSYRMRFIRPIRWLVSLWNEKDLPFELEMVRSGRITRGHRFLATEPVELPDAESYEGHLRRNSVIADYNQRRETLINQVRALEKKHFCHVRMEERLLQEVTNLVEWPTAMMGEFEEPFLKLPEAVLVTCMAVHQRYFPVFLNDPEGNQTLQPRFVAVSNGSEQGLETVCRGNARVLRARLSDARFFYEEDVRVEVDEYRKQLEGVVFFQNRGSQAQRVERLIELSSRIAEMLGYGRSRKQKSRRIAELCKFDLQTQMVYEFPELQGVMGEVYAEFKGEEPEICRGIREHYLPRIAGDSLPEDLETLPVALADRIDLLAVAFSLQLIPTGSADPFALRRTAQGVVQIVLGLRLSLDWPKLAREAVEILQKQQESLPESGILQEQLVDFLHQRERWYFEDRGFRYDLVEALLRHPEGTPLRRQELAEELESNLGKDSFKKAVEAVVRVVNISTKFSDGAAKEKLKEAMLQTPEELAFHTTLKRIGTKGELPADHSAKMFLSVLYELEPVITDFFDGVMVMDEDPVKRDNRLSLCSTLSRWAASRLDLREIVFPGKEGPESPDES